jgi:glycosyltransferase A (GT-A) superfamily protein (DUF2064 family)
MRGVIDRLLVVFARAPLSEARDKGLPERPASELFAAIAREWREAARSAGARIAISAPPEDLRAWRRALPDADDVSWIEQRGSSFGIRLEDTSRRANRFARYVVVTGGDVVPSPDALGAAFGALASGADAALAPAPDGGISIVALPRDADLLRSIGRRRRDVFRSLWCRLRSRRRAVAIVAPLADVDGRRALRRVAAIGPLRDLVRELRRARVLPLPRECPTPFPHPAPARSSAVLRGPPLAA